MRKPFIYIEKLYCQLNEIKSRHFLKKLQTIVSEL